MLVTWSRSSHFASLIFGISVVGIELPRQKKGVQKEWWIKGLTELRNKSIEIHTLWISQGRPRQGMTRDERIRVRASYKHALRAAQRAPKQGLGSPSWSIDRKWYLFVICGVAFTTKTIIQVPTVVNGISSKDGIANSFMHHFSKHSTPNNPKNVEKFDKKFHDAYQSYATSHSESCDCKSNHISIINVIDALLGMKRGTLTIWQYCLPL